MRVFPDVRPEAVADQFDAKHLALERCGWVPKPFEGRGRDIRFRCKEIHTGVVFNLVGTVFKDREATHAMAKYWMITNRARSNDGFRLVRGSLSFWVSDDPSPLSPDTWTELPADTFRDQLLAAVQAFPLIEDPAKHYDQHHVGLFVHGYNVGWREGVERYLTIERDLYSARDNKGVCVLFAWPSDGLATNYVPDRVEARHSADDLADVLTGLYEIAAASQRLALRDAEAGKQVHPCRAKISIVAHSMGNYVLQEGMNVLWVRKNKPLLVSLVNQLLMVAADVDNDLFKLGERIGDGDGEGIANLTYRVTALYTGLDAVLGLSAGFKHFGKRRLGRSGLDRHYPVPDNVWDLDGTQFLDASGISAHSAWFDDNDTIALMNDLLRGFDRDVVRKKYNL